MPGVLRKCRNIYNSASRWVVNRSGLLTTIRSNRSGLSTTIRVGQACWRPLGRRGQACQRPLGWLFHWDTRTSCSKVHLMTSSTSNTHVWSSLYGHDSYQIWCKCLYPMCEIVTFFKIQYGYYRSNLGVSQLENFVCPAIIAVWCFMSVTNLVQTSLVVADSDTLLFPPFMWWHHVN